MIILLLDLFILEYFGSFWGLSRGHSWSVREITISDHRSFWCNSNPFHFQAYSVITKHVVLICSYFVINHIIYDTNKYIISFDNQLIYWTIFRPWCHGSTFCVKHFFNIAGKHSLSLEVSNNKTRCQKAQSTSVMFACRNSGFMVIFLQHLGP